MNSARLRATWRNPWMPVVLIWGITGVALVILCAKAAIAALGTTMVGNAFAALALADGGWAHSVVPVIGLALGAWALLVAWEVFAWSRAVVLTPSSQPRSAAQGLVELVGRAAQLPGVSLHVPGAPDVPCAWYATRPITHIDSPYADPVVVQLAQWGVRKLQAGIAAIARIPADFLALRPFWTSDDPILLTRNEHSIVVDPCGAWVCPSASLRTEAAIASYIAQGSPLCVIGSLDSVNAPMADVQQRVVRNIAQDLIAARRVDADWLWREFGLRRDAISAEQWSWVVQRCQDDAAKRAERLAPGADGSLGIMRRGRGSPLIIAGTTEPQLRMLLKRLACLNALSGLVVLIGSMACLLA